MKKSDAASSASADIAKDRERAELGGEHRIVAVCKTRALSTVFGDEAIARWTNSFVTPKARR